MVDWNQVTNRLITGVEEYPPLPTFVNRIMLLNADPDSTLEEISRVIEAEVSLVASMMKLVNSPLFGLAQPVLSISRAISVLGRNELMNLVLASAMFQSYKGVRYKKRYIYGLGFHCFKCAMVARYLGRQVNHTHGDLFLAGLLHDIGKNIIYRNLSEDVLAELYNRDRATYDDTYAEMEHLGIDHTTLGGRLLAAWGFPLPLQIAVRYHHRPDMAQEYSNYSLIVHAADNLVHIMDARQDDEQETMELFQKVFTEQIRYSLKNIGLVISEENLVAILSELEEEFAGKDDLAAMFT